ncbi:MAG: hypothetical protein H8E41_01260 [Desulfobulbaceae bacterium]|uniref:Uncharacterized protein n=1 Tax=Candidatus Desulfobia pelagia TaxID=2841692 RepID=A0A8J6NDM1_9BACT|nr:hypothetical protein [Candidatus Desulfobia pelagia]
METFAKDFVVLLQYLLPGFITAWVFYSFTSFPKSSQFERIVQALIFTFLIQILVFFVEVSFSFFSQQYPASNWNKHYSSFFSVIIAVLLGVVFSYFTNNDKVHKKLRDWGITKETSYPSEWFGTFLKNITYIVLHLKDERRLYGWPIEWPSEPERGHFVLEQASWLDEEKEIPITGVSAIMVDVREVKWVEFMEKTWERENG